MLCCALAAQDNRRILVVTASSGDYIVAAGGTLAKRVRDGWRVTVAQFGNDEKFSLGATQAQTRLANVTEGKAAAKLLEGGKNREQQAEGEAEDAALQAAQADHGVRSRSAAVIGVQ